MSTLTLKTIGNRPREWQSQHGPMFSIKLWFEERFPDGSNAGEINTNDLGKMTDRLNLLIGRQSEYIVEDRGNWEDGNPKPKKIKLPQTSTERKSAAGAPSGGSSGSWVPRWRDGPEAEEYQQERMDRRTALMQAVASFHLGDAAGYAEPGRIMVIADEYYAWLRQNAANAVQAVAPRPGAEAHPTNGEPGQAGPKISDRLKSLLDKCEEHDIGLWLKKTAKEEFLVEDPVKISDHHCTSLSSMIDRALDRQKQELKFIRIGIAQGDNKKGLQEYVSSSLLFGPRWAKALEDEIAKTKER